MKKVYFLLSAYLKLKTLIQEADCQYEVGGVLLGIQLQNKFFVIETTGPEPKNKKTFQFLLNGSYQTYEANRIAKQYNPTLRWIGVWHSHIYAQLGFSSEDRLANKTLAEQAGGILSMIAIQDELTGSVVFAVYNILSNGLEEKCECIIMS